MVLPTSQREKPMSVTINSEIAGQVWKLVATPGDQLRADDVILILESMKMEIPILAPTAGVLAEILVAEEDMIGEGQPVARLDAGA
jgi:acetyl-CoA carboxylase biotin carboxyl carrier protein